MSMKDKIGLLVFGAAVACAAWAFWHCLQQDAFALLSLVFVVTLAVDNVRLRRALRATRK